MANSKIRSNQLKRIKRFIKSAEKRGYHFDEALKKNLSTFSTQKLKQLTPKKLYQQATSTTFGVEMPATRARKIERSMAGQKAWETRKNKEDEYIPNYTDIVLSNVEAMIEQAMNDKWDVYRNNASYLKEALDNEIATYGRDKVAMACEEAPDTIIALAHKAIYASTQEEARTSATALIMLIRSHIPTIKESKEYSEAMEFMDNNQDLYEE